MINRKGYLGRLISFIPVFIILIVLMGGFIFLSGLIKSTKGFSEINLEGNTIYSDILFNKVSVEDENYLIIDLIASRYEGKNLVNNIGEIVKPFLDETRPCFVLSRATRLSENEEVGHDLYPNLYEVESAICYEDTRSNEEKIFLNLGVDDLELLTLTKVILEFPDEKVIFWYYHGSKAEEQE